MIVFILLYWFLHFSILLVIRNFFFTGWEPYLQKIYFLFQCAIQINQLLTIKLISDILFWFQSTAATLKRIMSRCLPYYFCTASAMRTNSCMPSGWRSAWWIEIQTLTLSESFLERDSLLVFSVINFCHLLVFWEASRFLTSFWMQNISLVMLKLIDTSTRNFSFNFNLPSRLGL